MHVKPSWDAQCIAVPDPMHQNVPQSISNKGRHIFLHTAKWALVGALYMIADQTNRVAQIQIQKEFRIKRQLNILIQIQKHIQLLKHKNIFDTLPSGLCQCTLYDRRSLSQSCAGCLVRARLKLFEKWSKDSTSVRWPRFQSCTALHWCLDETRHQHGVDWGQYTCRYAHN